MSQLLLSAAIMVARTRLMSCYKYIARLVKTYPETECNLHLPCTDNIHFSIQNSLFLYLVRFFYQL